MRILTVIFSLIFSYQAFAGGATGGTPGKELRFDSNRFLGGSGLIVGESTIDLSEIHAIGEGRLALEKSRLMDVVAGSLTHQPMALNGEPLTAEHFDFANSRLSLRSLSDPSLTITLETITDTE